MKCLAGKYPEAISDELLIFCKCCTFQNMIPSVFLVVEQRMPDMAEVNPYLVSPARLKFTFYKRDISQVFEYSVVCYCRLSFTFILKYLHYFTVFQTPSYIPGYSSLGGIRGAPHKGMIFPVCRPFIELPRKPVQCQFIFCYHQYPRCVFVYPVHETGPGLTGAE